MTNILISNIEIIPGKRVSQHLGLVLGSTVLAKHAGKATDRMIEQARVIGANAVINVRYSTSSIAAGASEILAYGTAVFLEEK